MQKSIILLQNNQLRNWDCNQTTISFKSQQRWNSCPRPCYCNQTTISFKSQRKGDGGGRYCNQTTISFKSQQYGPHLTRAEHCNQTTISFKSQHMEHGFPVAIYCNQTTISFKSQRKGDGGGGRILIKQRFPSNYNALARSLNFLLYFNPVTNLPRLNGIY